MMREYNFDGLVGPTHNYAGLSFGNLASASHQQQVSHPRQAALQGLEKMKKVASLGIGQAILPPLLRPDLSLLRRLGFSGKSDQELIANTFRVAPQMVANCYSAANMWTANAATVSPSIDCRDGKLHLTPANLGSTLHRSLEAEETGVNLSRIFADPTHFQVHPPLPAVVPLTDEGAANHIRLCPEHGSPAIEIFVYGVDWMQPEASRPQKFPARQTRLASESVGRAHQLAADRTMYWQQNPLAIDAGVFHNDVISVGNQNVLLIHQMAFVDQPRLLQEVSNLYRRLYGEDLLIVEFSQRELPLADAVRSYLFNSQLLTRPDGGMTLICPEECRQISTAFKAIERLLAGSNPVDQVEYLDLRQSMNNGGGPACLRLRVALTEPEAEKIHPTVLLTDTLALQLSDWIQTHYRESLHPNDLADPRLLDESRTAHQALNRILGFGD
jgi:succinylarginine dihydrolase